MIFEILFFGCIVAAFYAYFGYPISLMIGGFVRGPRQVHRAIFFPRLTLIITAYNEEKRIKVKLENTLEVEYPRDKLQVIVASDASTDRTNEIAKGYRDRGVELLALTERQGKENAQAEAIRAAKGDILVFTDVATILGEEALKEIVSNFSDPAIGCVSSEDRILPKEGRGGGEGFYVRYEMWLRKLESRANTVVGLSGSFFAARKEVCQDFSREMQSDFRTLLNSVKMGLRGVSDCRSIGHYEDISDEKREFDRKVRTVLRGLTVFFRHLGFLNVFRYGFFSYQYFCHKPLRWLVPMFLILALVSNLFLAGGSGFYGVLLAGQVVFYGLALIGWGIAGHASAVVVRIPKYFIMVNASILVAWIRYMKGERLVMWTPSQR